LVLFLVLFIFLFKINFNILSLVDYFRVNFNFLINLFNSLRELKIYRRVLFFRLFFLFLILFFIYFAGVSGLYLATVLFLLRVILRVFLVLKGGGFSFNNSFFKRFN
jgi:hypothetical protein